MFQFTGGLVGRDGQALILHHHAPPGDLRHGVHQPGDALSFRFDLRELHVDAHALFHQGDALVDQGGQQQPLDSLGVVLPWHGNHAQALRQHFFRG